MQAAAVFGLNFLYRLSVGSFFCLFEVYSLLSIHASNSSYFINALNQEDNRGTEVPCRLKKEK